MKWNALSCAFLSIIVMLGAGCGGFSASRSVSPAGFFLPGFGKTSPPTPSPVLAAATEVQPDPLHSR